MASDFQSLSLEADSAAGSVKTIVSELLAGFSNPDSYPVGHERSLTQIKFNTDGDLLFSASKDHIINVWYAHNGERLGTYDGHNGTVWTIDVDCEFTSVPFRLQLFTKKLPFSRIPHHSVTSLHRRSSIKIPRFRISGQHPPSVVRPNRKMLVPLGVPDSGQTCSFQ